MACALLKCRAVMELPLLRCSQAGSQQAGVVAAFYARGLLALVRQVVQVVPLCVVQLLEEASHLLMGVFTYVGPSMCCGFVCRVCIGCVLGVYRVCTWCVSGVHWMCIRRDMYTRRQYLPMHVCVYNACRYLYIWTYPCSHAPTLSPGRSPPGCPGSTWLMWRTYLSVHSSPGCLPALLPTPTACSNTHGVQCVVHILYARCLSILYLYLNTYCSQYCVTGYV